LVVEDNAVNQMVASASSSGWVAQSTSLVMGKKAVEMTNNRAYDIVFLDGPIPVMDGYKATAEIRRREVPVEHNVIVAMTANAMKGIASGAPRAAWTATSQCPSTRRRSSPYSNAIFPLGARSARNPPALLRVRNPIAAATKNSRRLRTVPFGVRRRAAAFLT
jgi:CheY-like chemotaxis protein